MVLALGEVLLLLKLVLYYWQTTTRERVMNSMSITAPQSKIRKYMEETADALPVTNAYRLMRWRASRVGIAAQLAVLMLLAGAFFFFMETTHSATTRILNSGLWAVALMTMMSISHGIVLFFQDHPRGVWIEYNLQHLAFEHGLPPALVKKVEQMESTYSDWRYVLYALHHFNSERPLGHVLWIMPLRNGNAPQDTKDALILDSSWAPVALP